MSVPRNASIVEDDEEWERWLTDLDELERIADSAILLVREESGKAPPELIQLDELVGSIGAELRDQILDVTETTVEPVKVRASRLTLNRALRNLIINAATHGVRARVKVGGLNGAARIVIEDDGPGLPPDLLDQVFEPFSAPTRAASGHSRRGSRPHHRARDHSAGRQHNQHLKSRKRGIEANRGASSGGRRAEVREILALRRRQSPAS